MKNDPLIYDKLHQTALKAPKLPGVYLWKDENQEVIYVGKAKNLKNRLSSYFSGIKDIKTKTLISKAFLIEYITTDNEYEALILENTLIKKYSPRYNINLKDDKSYPVLRITNEDFPRIFRTRRIIQDGSKYFGPFPNAGALSTFTENLYKQYPLRQCKKLRKRSSPCMYYHIGRCAAPCCEKISKESYNQIIEEIIHLLEENPKETVQKLTLEMKECAKALDFEKAAKIRDNIDAIKALHIKNSVSDFNTDSRDYIGFATEGTLVSFAVLKMREGRLIARDLYRTKSLNTDEELINEFLMAYYVSQDLFPSQIFIPINMDVNLFRQWSEKEMEIQAQIFTPEVFDSKHNSAMEMAEQNAKEDIIRRLRERSDTPALEELKQLLKLDHLPTRIEGFDIAHIGGKFPVASLISFYNGNPDKKNYRYFRLKTTDGIIDDFASMREATARRYTRLLNENAELPDLILIDGGIGQVNAVKGVLSTLDLDIPIIGLAEKNEDIYLPGNSTPIQLPKRSDALRLLQRVRDETHRFATSKNQALRTKEKTANPFLELPHIGSKRAMLLLKTYGTIQNLIDEVTKKGLSHLAETATLSPVQATETFQAAKILLSNQQ
ncbi:MAG: excinuclease ABC subunit UvrC [Spirochaetaceae bacterium]|nr:excinuclease ABC subunit UvrC [Spirochaetaceae bacterium]